MPNREDQGIAGSCSDSERLLKGWLALADYSKSIVTLATALLGLTVTFADSILSRQASALQSDALLVAWAGLLVSILSGVAALAFSVNVILHDKKKKRTTFCANLSFFALSVAMIAFGVLGIVKLVA